MRVTSFVLIVLVKDTPPLQTLIETYIKKIKKYKLINRFDEQLGVRLGGFVGE